MFGSCCGTSPSARFYRGAKLQTIEPI
jgi:hypothetical protein